MQSCAQPIITTQQITTDAFEHILKSVWNGVAQSTISKKLALNCAHLQIIQFVGSYISNATENKEILIGMKDESDPIAIPIDNIAYGQMVKQMQPKSNNNNGNTSSRKMSLAESVNQTRSRKYTIESVNKQKSPESKNNQIPEKDPGQEGQVQDEKQNKKQKQKLDQFITLPQVEDPHYVLDKQQDGCRNHVFRGEKQAKDMKKLLADRQKERQQSGNKNKKLIKDLKKFTYDYEGKFFGVGQMQSAHQKVLKIDKNEGQQNVTHKQSTGPQSKTIQNDKIKQRLLKTNRELNKDDKNVPQFNDKRPESLIDMFQQDNRLSEGIKLIGEKNNEKIIKQRPRRKLSGIKQYRLNQYQGLTKDRKFKDFKKLAANFSTTTIDVNKTAPLSYFNPETTKNVTSFSHHQNQNQKPNNSSSQISLVIRPQKQQSNSILPPIQSAYLKKPLKLGSKRLSLGGYQQSSRSLLNQSGLQSRKSRKSQIKIDHQELYFQNFTHNTQIK